MKLTTKKLFSLGLGGLLAFSMVGCGSTSSTTEETTSNDTTTGEVVKPEKISMMVNGTFLKPTQDQNSLVAKYKELTGIDLELISIDHNSYNDQLALAFASGDVADVVILSAEYYSAYASQGALADISEYWENSETKASGRMNEEYIDSLYINDGLYGFAAQRGNGCVTYLRQDWLDNLGLAVPTTYDEYLAVLEAFTTQDPDGNGVNDTYGVTAAGIMTNDAPFTNYLPEFWQDAYPDVYQKEDGTWVDGFAEQATADALQRLKDAYNTGVIDIEVTTNKTSSCRDKLYSSKVGAFTYWAGKWNMTLEENIKAITPEAKLVALPPIAELGQYTERQSPVVAITSKCANPAGVFKYLFETMVDGAEGQMLFTYGVEGVHYETTGGTFTQLPDPENTANTFTSAYIDPVLSIADWIDADPLADSRDERIATSNELFSNNSKLAPVITSTDAMANYSATLKDIRSIIVAEVVTGDMTVEEGMASYHAQADSMIEEILASLN
ncbi:MAG: extracellular solute-binding protein [Cellulosilyticum sp.]|nr:extracellular solute-binding protein [Cellulosilyticum sp.]